MDPQVITIKLVKYKLEWCVVAVRSVSWPASVCLSTACCPEAQPLNPLLQNTLLFHIVLSWLRLNRRISSLQVMIEFLNNEGCSPEMSSM